MSIPADCRLHGLSIYLQLFTARDLKADATCVDFILRWNIDMPSYKLTYFDARGGAELTRLSLAVAKQKYDDVRVKREDWGQLKPSTPQGKLPILEVDGTVYPQSRAMLRFIARKHDLYGTDIKQNTEVDVVIETVQDLNEQMFKSFFENDKAEKAKLHNKLLDETVPAFMKVCTTILGDKEWMVGNKLTIADLAVFNVFDYIVPLSTEVKGKDVYEGFPAMKKHADRVKNVPEIKAWLEKRPKTEF